MLVERSGKVEVEGTAIDRDGSGDRLNFWTTDLGQTHLPALIDSLAAIEERFPSSANPEYDCVE